MNPYVALTLAIFAEVAATSALKASAQFTQLWPSTIVVVGYGISFYLLTIVLESLAIGVTYAIWSAVGIILVTLAAIPLYRQLPDGAALLGIGLIIAGVLVIHLFSESARI
ncbi:MAG: multidrug efflux SMR transporter [Gammaproteobacteria bacterium]|nr:multidrug efflux SMR transporter [Pseudomonadota bacterium]